MTKIIQLPNSRGEALEKILTDLKVMFDNGELDQLHVVFKDKEGMNWLSSAGDWSGLCIAAIMMQDYAQKTGS